MIIFKNFRYLSKKNEGVKKKLENSFVGILENFSDRDFMREF